MNRPLYLLDLTLPPCDRWPFPITDIVVMLPSFPYTDDFLGNKPSALKFVPETRFQQYSEEIYFIQYLSHSTGVKITLKWTN